MSDSERQDYFFSVLEMHLRDGKSSSQAMVMAVDDLAYVFDLKPAAQKTAEQPGTTTNTGRQSALQMPPSCPECVVYRGCDGHRGNDYCSARLWRHFCHA